VFEMSAEVIIPAQVRAARALLGWSQEQLAKTAEVAVSSVREIEGERRSLVGTEVIRNVRTSLENAGVVFLPGAPGVGPGVRIIADLPPVVRPPAVRKFGDVHFGVAWHGREVTVDVAYEVVSRFGDFSSRQPDTAYLKVFSDNRVKILKATARALVENRIDEFERIRLTPDDFAGFVPMLSLSTSYEPRQTLP